ncbi:OTU-like cysteine protease [Musa troglodytarum]|uniref:ubiquitinyl hydrolase 1 n=1 Tax=Musa troglodytarum TaxID=320322 RepID=A0A9E7HX53_9LILI|nr:OTU-like cysteine protease [Musa troglodytarum]
MSHDMGRFTSGHRTRPIKRRPSRESRVTAAEAAWLPFIPNTVSFVVLMIMYEQDPDLVRWGLHLLLEPPSNSTYCATSSHSSTDDSGLHCADETGSWEARDSVENDEVIAHALQEELSQIAMVEASGPSLVTEEPLQESVLTQNWLASSTTSKNISGTLIEDLENMGASISCSTSNDKLNCGENCLLELADDSSTLDGEVCKRLNHMTSIPHVPRINKELPSVDEEISDHQRLLERLRLYDLVDLKVQGDGNCQFRALSDQLYRSPEYHTFVRQQVVDQLRSHPEIYDGYVPMSYDDYLKNMSKNGEWGDHVTLQAAADSYGVKIFILTSFKDTCYIEILPSVEKSKRVVCLSFWAEVHYNSIYPEGDLVLLLGGTGESEEGPPHLASTARVEDFAIDRTSRSFLHAGVGSSAMQAVCPSRWELTELLVAVEELELKVRLLRGFAVIRSTVAPAALIGHNAMANNLGVVDPAKVTKKSPANFFICSWNGLGHSRQRRCVAIQGEENALHLTRINHSTMIPKNPRSANPSDAAPRCSSPKPNQLMAETALGSSIVNCSSL